MTVPLGQLDEAQSREKAVGGDSDQNGDVESGLAPGSTMAQGHRTEFPTWCRFDNHTGNQFACRTASSRGWNLDGLLGDGMGY